MTQSFKSNLVQGQYHTGCLPIDHFNTAFCCFDSLISRKKGPYLSCVLLSQQKLRWTFSATLNKICHTGFDLKAKVKVKL